MEEAAKPAQDSPQTTKTENPNRMSNKRRVDDEIKESSYFKMRAVLRDVRPHFLEVLRTADFRSCKGAEEVREKMKLLMQLYKQMTAEVVAVKADKNELGDKPIPGENGTGLKPQVFAKPYETKPFSPVIASERKPPEDGERKGTYIVGGSAFGWNFITFPGNKLIFYGRTKEQFRSARTVLRDIKGSDSAPTINSEDVKDYAPVTS